MPLKKILIIPVPDFDKGFYFTLVNWFVILDKLNSIIQIKCKKNY